MQQKKNKSHERPQRLRLLRRPVQPLQVRNSTIKCSMKITGRVPGPRNTFPARNSTAATAKSATTTMATATGRGAPSAAASAGVWCGIRQLDRKPTNNSNCFNFQGSSDVFWTPLATDYEDDDDDEGTERGDRVYI